MLFYIRWGRLWEGDGVGDYCSEMAFIIGLKLFYGLLLVEIVY